ncbi:hypothetical protein L7F22_068560 [Adiantum nelumboides]|nr:hypothetical protein [Adiantum nelumboides]
MKCDMTKLACGGRGSSSGTGPLFPPLHVNDTGNSSLKGPPRNKMALFEQFTVPYNCYLPSSKGASTESASKQRGSNEFVNTCTQYSMTNKFSAAAVFTSGFRGIGKSSHGSSLGSLSTCSAVVNVDEQVQEPEDDRCSLSAPILGMVYGKGGNANEKALKDNRLGTNSAKGVRLSTFGDHNGQACEQGVALLSDSFQKCTNVEYLGIKESTFQEVNNNNKGLRLSTGGQAFGFKATDCRPTENNTVSNSALSRDKTQLKENDKCIVEKSGIALKKPATVSQGDVDSIATMTPLGVCDKFKPLIPSLQDNIKPKHVIHAIGQQLFWKARKAILRQQEVFSSQVFELHKLVEVQKSLAKMPNTLIEDHLLPDMALDMAVGDLNHPKVNSKKKEISNKGAQEAPAHRRCQGQAHELRPPQSLPLQEGEGQMVGAESQVKRCSQSFNEPQLVASTPVGQGPRASGSDGISAWGYPMGSLNRPFLYPPGVGRFPPGAGLGGPYVVGSNPSMPPFTFPCYSPRPEQPALFFCQSNQWPTPMYNNPVFTPVANDWFAINYPNQVPLTSGGEKPGPTNPVPSINMNAEASSQSVQPAVVPLSRRQQLGASSCTKFVGANFFGSVATASLAAPVDALSGQPVSVGYVDGHNPAPNRIGVSKVMPKAFTGETGLAIEVIGPTEDTKEGAQVRLSSREERTETDWRSCEKNALNLFPLLPTNSLPGASDGQVLRHEGSRGRIVKAIPHSALAASESAAGILRCIQRERNCSFSNT